MFQRKIILQIILSLVGIIEGWSQSGFPESVDTGDQIEIVVKNCKTIVYPDSHSPLSDFWYIPEALYIERKVQDGRSRLTFSMELHADGKNPNADTLGFIALNMVIASNYDSSFEQQIKWKLIEMGRAVTNPFNPLLVDHINLRPLPAIIRNIAFDEVFVIANWTNKKSFQQKKVNLDKPFPVQLKLNHYDATIFLESLLDRRIHRVGRVELEKGLHVPLYFSLGFPEASLPVDYFIESNQKKWEVVFTNRTEHRIHLEGFHYYSKETGRWKFKSVQKILEPLTGEGEPPALFRVLLNSEPIAIKDIHWQAEYDFPSALNLYIKNLLPEKPATVHLNWDIDHASEGISRLFLEHFNNLRVEVVLTDHLGLSHKRFLQIDLERKESREYWTEKLTLPSFFGSKLLKYRIWATRIQSPSSSFVSHWKDYSSDYLGDEVHIWLSEELAGLTLVETERKGLDNPGLYPNIWMRGEGETANDNAYIVPNSLKIAETLGGISKIDLFLYSEHFSGSIELLAPVPYDMAMLALDSLGLRLKPAVLVNADIELKIADEVLFKHHSVKASPQRNNLILSPSIYGETAKRIEAGFQTRQPLKCKALLEWKIPSLGKAFSLVEVDLPSS